VSRVHFFLYTALVNVNYICFNRYFRQFFYELSSFSLISLFVVRLFFLKVIFSRSSA
jgi:hypothetical protein